MAYLISILNYVIPPNSSPSHHAGPIEPIWTKDKHLHWQDE